jgi:hypothetical protein
MQNVLTTTIDRGRGSLTSAVRQTRETGADLLGRAARRAAILRRAVGRRRASLNGRPIERLERQLLLGVENVLDRVGVGLRAQVRRLAPSSKARARSASARKRIRVPLERGDVTALAALPVKELSHKIATLSEGDLRALLAHEKATKQRKSVVAAIEAKLAR